MRIFYVRGSTITYKRYRQIPFAPSLSLFLVARPRSRSPHKHTHAQSYRAHIVFAEIDTYLSITCSRFAMFAEMKKACKTIGERGKKWKLQRRAKYIRFYDTHTQQHLHHSHTHTANAYNKIRRRRFSQFFSTFFVHVRKRVESFFREFQKRRKKKR